MSSHKVPSGTSSTSVPYSSTASPTLPQPPPLPQRRPEHDGTTEKDFRMCNKTWRKSLRCLRFHDQNGKWFPRPHANSFFLLQHAPPCMQQTVECSRKEGSTTVGGGGTCPNAANAPNGLVPAAEFQIFLPLTAVAAASERLLKAQEKVYQDLTAWMLTSFGICVSAFM